MTLDYDAVQKVIYGYWNALDRRDYPVMLDLLTEDVEWRAGAACDGRAAVAKALEQRPTKLVVRHFISNLAMEDGDDAREVFFLLAAFGRIARDGEASPYPSGVPHVIADVRATIVSTQDGPKIAKMHASVVIRAEEPA